MEEMPKAKYVGRSTEFASPLQGPLTPKCQRVLQTMSSLNPVLLGFYGSFIS